MTRAYWLSVLERLSVPVLDAAAGGRLRRDMPVRYRGSHPLDRREDASHLEAVGRLLCGIAPWLACPGLTGAEGRLQERLRRQAVATLTAIADPASPDHLLDGKAHQCLVDTAFLAQAILRAPSVLWEPLDALTRARILEGFGRTRRIKPPWNNWLCFAAMIETAQWVLGGRPDLLRIDVCLRAHEGFFMGDGAYGDGPRFHWDYYNSYVIHPMLLDILDNVAGRTADQPLYWDAGGVLRRADAVGRAQRFALVQERLIAPDGSFPVIGRSIVYRMAAFQTLAQIILRGDLPQELPLAQARCALTATTRLLMEAPQTWDAAGWLHIGLCGHQPSLGESYISTGSLYLCSTGLLPLGLPPAHAFWSDPDQPWTSVRAFRGDDLPADHAW